MLMLSVPCGHSLALYFTQVNFSPSSSKLWMWFWFLCLVWRRWISFNQHLHAAHVICPPSFHEHLSVLVLFLCLTGIVSTTSTCFILLFLFTSRIHGHECFLSPFCFWTVGICVTQLVSWTPFFRLLAKNASLRWVRSTPPGTSEKQKVSQGKKHQRGRILNEIRRLEGSIFPSQYQ